MVTIECNRIEMEMEMENKKLYIFFFLSLFCCHLLFSLFWSLCSSDAAPRDVCESVVVWAIVVASRLSSVAHVLGAIPIVISVDVSLTTGVLRVRAYKSIRDA